MNCDDRVGFQTSEAAMDHARARREFMRKGRVLVKAQSATPADAAVNGWLVRVVWSAFGRSGHRK